MSERKVLYVTDRQTYTDITKTEQFRRRNVFHNVCVRAAHHFGPSLTKIVLFLTKIPYAQKRFYIFVPVFVDM